MNLPDSRKLHNRLWKARKRLRLTRKQTALILRHKTIDQVARYERGLRLPTLETALRLEILLGVPLRYLYADLHKSLKQEIEQQVRSNPGLKCLFESSSTADGIGEFCSHSERLQHTEHSPEEADQVRGHITRLARHIANL